MKLIEQIRIDRLEARKIKDTVKANLLGCLIADACKMVKEPEDVDVMNLIGSFIKLNKQTQESLPAVSVDGYDKANRDKCNAELLILQGYRPAQLTEEDIKGIIESIVKPDTKANIGMLMKHFSENYKDQYDGKLVSTIVKQYT